MSFDRIILWIMAFGVLIGAADKCMGNRLRLGEKFEEGFQVMGSLTLGMVGMISLAPVISDILGPVIIPACQAIGADPALFGAVLANDMGGYALAMELAQNEEAGLFAGTIVASMFGGTLVFTIPVGLGMVEAENYPCFSKGLLIGLISIPFGCIAGGLAAGFSVRMIISNTLPVLVFSLLLALGLKMIPDKMIKGCMVFGKAVQILIYIGLGAAVFEYITGVVLIKNMAPVMEGMAIVAGVAVVLAGAFPILTLLVKLLDKPLNIIGERIGVNVASVAGIIFTLANAVPVFTMMKEMDKRGIIINTAWMVPVMCVLGDHLGFTASVEPSMITPMIVGKLTAGLIALLLAYLMTKNMREEETL